MKSTGRAVRRATLIVCLALLALLFLYYGTLLRRIEAANDAFRTRNDTVAQRHYDSALEEFHRFPYLKTVLRPQYQSAVFNSAQLLYQRRRYSEVVELLEKESSAFPKLAGTAPYHLWMGNALFRVAILQVGKEKEGEGTEALQAVADEYDKAIELDRNNWEARYNYEFVKDILARKTSKNAKEKEGLQLLLGEIRMTSQQNTSERPEKLQ